MTPSFKLRIWAYALNIDCDRRNLLLNRADELVRRFAEDSDIEVLARAGAESTTSVNETRFFCHAVDEILRRRFRSPRQARSVIFTRLSARSVEIIRTPQRTLASTPTPEASVSDNDTRFDSSAARAEILIIACDSGLRDCCATMTRSLPCEITTASDGLAALNELNRHNFDAILCEFFLPTIDGDGIYDELAVSKPHLRDRFIFMTTLDMISQPRISAFREQTRATFVILPCSAKTLTGAISAQLRTQIPSKEQTKGVNVSARETCDYVATRVIADLEAITDLLFGEDSGLANLWEEICVQRQGDESEVWSTYEATVNALTDSYLEDLSEIERRAIWLETDKGMDWQCEDDNEHATEPVISEHDIVEHIAGRYIYSRADQFSNDRVATFLSARESDG